MRDGTLPVTNLGAYRIDGFTPVINYPQVAILGVGAIREVPVFAEDGSVVRGSDIEVDEAFELIRSHTRGPERDTSRCRT